MCLGAISLIHGGHTVQARNGVHVTDLEEDGPLEVSNLMLYTELLPSSLPVLLPVRVFL